MESDGDGDGGEEAEEEARKKRINNESLSERNILPPVFFLFC